MTKEITGGDIKLQFVQSRAGETPIDPAIHVTCLEILSNISSGDIREYFNTCWTTFAVSGEKAFEQLNQIDQMKTNLLAIIDSRLAEGKDITESDVRPFAEKLHEFSAKSARTKLQ